MSDEPVPPGMLEQLKSPFQGLPSFAKQPFLTEPEQLDALKPDVAIVGAPWDGSTSNRPGARFGPRALRAQAYHIGGYHLDLGVPIFRYLDVVDYGDAFCSHGMVEASHLAIRTRVAEVASRGIFPVVIGGDHSITWPAATGVADHHGWGKIGVVHFDAHADTADMPDGNLASHGTPMRRLIESGAVLGRNFVQVGLRGYWPPRPLLDWMEGQGMRWHLMHELWERGVAAVMEDAISEALEGADALYLSVDIDVLDPGFAPGTGTPEPGGMSPVDLLRAVRAVALRTNLVAMDVVEVSPPYDHADITVNNAHRVILEVLGGLAFKQREAGRAPRTPGTLQQYTPDPRARPGGA